MLTNPQLNFLDQKQEAEAIDLQFTFESQAEDDNDRAMGAYDAQCGYFPHYASDAYLQGYCEGIKKLAHGSNLAVSKPNKFEHFLNAQNDEDIPF